MTHTIAIIGAGLSGTLTAIHLLSLSTSPLTIYLIDQTGRFGLGLAYSPPSEAFKLNVRANAMGAIASDPEGFLRWLQKRRPSTKPDEFVPRSLYGEYLQEILAQAEGLARSHTLKRISNEVVDIQRGDSKSLSITLQDGSSICVDTCVLALGNIPRDTLRGASGLSTLRLPFQPESYTDVARMKEIFILGSSLTAVDVVLECERRGFSGRYTVLSRHGRFPLPHEEKQISTAVLPTDWHRLASASKLLTLIRTESQRLSSSQPVFDAMRPHIQSMWQNLPLLEKRRFLRHLQPIWDIHRHRIPTTHHETLKALQQAGRLSIAAGSFTRAESVTPGVRISLTLKGSVREEPIFDAGFLCIGPEGDLSRVTHPLVSNLLRRHLVTPGPLKLGVENSAPNLWILGPLQREQLWEITAAREIREEAQKIASSILRAAST